MPGCKIDALNALYEAGPVAFTDMDRQRYFRSLAFSLEPDGCWLRRNTMFWLQGHSVSATRAGYAMFVGPVPRQLEVCHTCDVRNCGRLTHLFLGTAADNANDAFAKGRRAVKHGADNPMAKITYAQAEEIRARYGTWTAHGKGRSFSQISMEELGAEYGIGAERVCLIVRGLIWTSES